MTYRTRVIRSLAELECIRPLWEARHFHPNSDIDHFVTVCRLRSKEVLRPHVILVETDVGETVAVVAAREEYTSVTPNIGYLRGPELKTRVLNLIHEGTLGKLDSYAADAVVKHVRNFLDSGECDLAVFSQVLEGDSLLASSNQTIPWMWRDAQPTWSLHWKRILPSKPGFLLEEMKSKHRAWIKKKIRVLAERYPKGIAYRQFNQPEQVREACSDMEKVAKLTYQRGLGAGFHNDAEHRARYDLFSKRGEWRCWVLYLDNAPKAFWVGAIYRGTFHSEATGFDPELREYEIGTQIFLHLADSLVSEGVTAMDFGMGDAPYKSRFGDRSHREGSFRIYGARLRPFCLRCANGLAHSVETTLRKLLDSYHMIDKVKALWRQRISGAQRKAGN